MFLFRKIGQWLSMLTGIFVEKTDDRFSIEQRLQYDRQRRAEELKRQRLLAVDVGAYAQELAQELGEATVEVEDLRAQAKDHVARANAAKTRGDDAAEQQELARASQLAEELAEAEDHLAQLQREKEEALHDKEEAYQIITDGIDQLRAQAREDARLGRRAGMAELRERSLEMREKLSQMIPEDRDNVRAEIGAKLGKREARLEARRELTDRILSRQQEQKQRQAQEISAKGRSNLSELFAEVGYTPTAVDTGAGAAATAAQSAGAGAAATAAQSAGASAAAEAPSDRPPSP